MKANIEKRVRRYLEAVAQKDLKLVGSLMTPDVTFEGPVMKLSGVQAVLESLRRIGAIHVGSEVRKVFVDGHEACVVYDFVTDAVGSVPTIEWLEFEGERIKSVKLYYDQLPWQTLRQKLAERAQRATA